MSAARRSNLSDRELGALATINRNVSRAHGTDALSCDIRTDEGIQIFCDLMQVSLEDLEALGATSRALGCSDKYAERESAVTLREDKKIWLYRAISTEWRDLDGTAARGAEDEEARHKVATAWSNNSCAVDSLIAAAIHIDAWRTKLDILEPKRMKELSLPATLLRQLMHYPWGILSQKDRDELRDILCKGLESHDSTQFSRGRFMAVGTAMDTCFAGMPQMSWTECRVMFCCDNKERMNDWKPRKVNHLCMMLEDPTEKYTLGDAITERMLQARNATTSDPCSSGDNCLKSRTIRTSVVLDRLPGTLMIHAGSSSYCVTKERADEWKAFDVLQVEHNARGHAKRTVQYEPTCAVFFVRGGHFITRVKLSKADKLGNEIGHFDGASRVNVKDWWSGLKTDKNRDQKKQASVTVLIYTLVGV